MSLHNDAHKSEEGFRPLLDLERLQLRALLSVDFPGRDALMEQAKVVSARPIDQNGSLGFQSAPSNMEIAKVVRRIPVEAELKDRDGVTIHVLLHVVDGLLHELEIYRDDSGRVQRELAPKDFRLVVL